MKETKQPEARRQQVVSDKRQAPPTHEQIARRAFELFLSRGGEHGRHEEDWHRAERELRAPA